MALTILLRRQEQEGGNNGLVITGHRRDARFSGDDPDEAPSYFDLIKCPTYPPHLRDFKYMIPPAEAIYKQILKTLDVRRPAI